MPFLPKASWIIALMVLKGTICNFIIMTFKISISVMQHIMQSQPPFVCCDPLFIPQKTRLIIMLSLLLMVYISSVKPIIIWKPLMCVNINCKFCKPWYQKVIKEWEKIYYAVKSKKCFMCVNSFGNIKVASCFTTCT